MKLKDIIFPVIAAILPVGVYELVTYELEKTDFNFTVMLLAGVTSFILLVAISSFLEFASCRTILLAMRRDPSFAHINPRYIARILLQFFNRQFNRAVTAAAGGENSFKPF